MMLIDSSANTSEPIDAAYLELESIVAQRRQFASTIVSEADVRLKIIDPILKNVLLWGVSDIVTEEQSGIRFLDYKMSIHDSARLIIEVKRDSRSFELTNRIAGRGYKLDGPAFNNAHVSEGIEQAISYCGRKNVELACVTNGDEWIIFRGSRLGDGIDTRQGQGIIFPSLDAVQDKFRLFYDLLSKSSVDNYLYRAFFQELEGRPVRRQLFQRSLLPPNQANLMKRSSLERDLDRVMTTFFRRLEGDKDPNMLAECFVVTPQSKDAEVRLARISESLANRVRDLNTENAEELDRIIERAKATGRNEFVLVIGTKGAGKTTFIDRYFELVMPSELRAQCINVKINVADNGGDENTLIDWLDEALLHSLEFAIYGNEPPTFEDLQGLFFDEYKRWQKGPMYHLYKKDKDEFKIEFGKHVNERRERKPHEYVCRLVNQIVKSRKKFPCIVFDNADHFSIPFQEKVFQYARSIYESELCLIIMPVTDKTSWQLPNQGALQSFENEYLYLPTPSPRRIIERRIDYIERLIASEKPEQGTGYFFSRGIDLDIKNLQGFAACLQRVFLQSGTVARLIGNLANLDIRRCLKLVHEVMSSPHLRIEDLVTAYISKSTFDLSAVRIKKAIIRGQNFDYVSASHQFVRNVFAIDTQIETTPLITLRMLQLLRDAAGTPGNADNRYLRVDHILDYFQAMQLEPRVVSQCLAGMLNAGLCFSYDPTVTNISKAERIELSPSGFQHLFFGLRDKIYFESMMYVTPFLDEAKFNEIDVARADYSWRGLDRMRAIFHSYLFEEDQRYCRVPDHDAYISQKELDLRVL